MIPVLINLLPLIVAASLGGPMWTIIPLLLLRGAGGVIKAAAFASGATIVRLLQGLLFGSVCHAATDAGAENESDVITATLQLVIGLFLLLSVVKAWNKEVDPDEPPPKWLKAVSGMSAITAFGVGAMFIAIGFKQWIFTLAAIAVINEAGLGPKSSVVAYLFFVAAAQTLMLAPIISSAVAPARSAKALDVVRAWMERNNRLITLAISLIFGVWLLAKGTSDLLNNNGN